MIDIPKLVALFFLQVEGFESAIHLSFASVLVAVAAVVAPKIVARLPFAPPSPDLKSSEKSIRLEIDIATATRDQIQTLTVR